MSKRKKKRVRRRASGGPRPGCIRMTPKDRSYIEHQFGIRAEKIPEADAQELRSIEQYAIGFLMAGKNGGFRTVRDGKELTFEFTDRDKAMISAQSVSVLEMIKKRREEMGVII